ncbi:4-hydroxy-tetrahydrodipicolinate synthase [Candidatus Comchoanobacter bicostacola]|uniref:4-hydroxy-tetrahydrodipicolinate synthase n=1 Tax=Candidatus Comchoanobacter bicostacola TaxID=2919598 RepID=A0ABY5DKG3_9GAMM|nr:4-hydroxy-tetrahydrodipicolinate synthase [Candidatus Comchoanobacter bicostacola]UTC24975.1 4-hydroxy-tetrahydrodipicolinate synthase [Candidatus Comchoanobacter bicostacola]
MMDDGPASIVALVTPLNYDHEVDLLALKRILDLHVASGTEGIVLFGSTGEGVLLSAKDRQEIFSYIFEEYHLSIPVWVACSHPCVSSVLSLIAETREFPIEGVMVACPMYIKPSQSGLIQYFSMIADQAHVPVMLYNIPSRTGCSLLPETVMILAQHNNISGIKDVEISEERMHAYHSIVKDFHVYSGDDQQVITCLHNGGRGIISVSGNIVPKLLKQLCESNQQGEHHIAYLIEKKLSPLNEILARNNNPSAIKWLMAEQGWLVNILKPPLSTISLDEQEGLASVFSSYEEYT